MTTLSLVRTGLYSIFIIAGFTGHMYRLQAQIIPTPPCWQHHADLVVPLAHAPSHLPLGTGMPYDVMIGYIIYDSLAHAVNTPGFNTLYENLTYSDTLRYAMKYAYKLVDYDPLLFEQFRGYSDPLRRYALIRTKVFQKMLQKIRQTSPDPFVETLLCQSSIIAHIQVADTVRVVDTANSISLTNHIVTATVLDTIKGKVMPPCINLYPHLETPSDLPASALQANYGACLQFAYALEWQRIPFGSNIKVTANTMVNPDGTPWVKKNAEYIVFLNFASVCSDSTHVYHIISSFGTRSSSNNIYPIVDGRVQDPDNDFGLGTTPTVAEFKHALRQKIYAITHYGE